MNYLDHTVCLQTALTCGYIITNVHTLSYALLTIICTEDYLDCEKYDSASFMYSLNNVDNLDTVIRKHMYGFMQRVCNSNNSLVNAVTASTLFLPKSVWQHWFKSLYTINI